MTGPGRFTPNVVVFTAKLLIYLWNFVILNTIYRMTKYLPPFGKEIETFDLNLDVSQQYGFNGTVCFELLSRIAAYVHFFITSDLIVWLKKKNSVKVSSINFMDEFTSFTFEKLAAMKQRYCKHKQNIWEKL